MPPNSTPPAKAARSCRSCFLLDGWTEALAVVRTTGRPVTHMKLDVLSLLQPNAPASPGEPGVGGELGSENEALGPDFAAVFAQVAKPTDPELPGQTLADAAEVGALAAAGDDPMPELPSTADVPVPVWMPMPPPPLTPAAPAPASIALAVVSASPAAVPPPLLAPQPNDSSGVSAGAFAQAVSTDGQTLKSTWLPQGRLQLITPTVPSTDTGTDSLMAFAQGQGLDDAALQRLFGDEFKPAGPNLAKAALLPAAAWIAFGQRQAGVHPPVVDPDTPATSDWPDRLAMERAALSLLPPRRSAELSLPKALNVEGPAHGMSNGDDGRLELELDLSAALAELSPDTDLKALRAEERAALSLRIGEMLAQRMVAQAQRGQWQLRFALNPQHLGRVEIDMQMRGGELEATFAALNPSTREMLQEALPRLREMLQQSGMDVASLNVGSGGASKNGGQPTPRGQGASPTEGDSTPADASQPHVRAQGADGWDIWV